MVGFAVLLLDLVTGPYLLFPILFVIPVVGCAWFSSTRIAYLLACVLPIGRLVIAFAVDHPSPWIFMVTNALIRLSVLLLLAYLVSLTSRQTRALKKQVEQFVRMCAWSRTVEFEGEWISFEQYLKMRFGVSTSHGISPAEAERLLGPDAGLEVKIAA